MSQEEASKTQVLLVTGLGSDDHDPVVRTARRLAEQNNGIQLHLPALNDVVKGDVSYVAVPSLSEQASRVREQTRSMDSSRVTRLVTHSIGLLVAAYAELDLDGIQVTAIAPGLTSVTDRIDQARVAVNDMADNEWDAIEHYEEDMGVAYGLIRRPTVSPLIISKAFMDEVALIDPIDTIAPMLKRTQTQYQPRIIFIGGDNRLGDQMAERAQLLEAVPNIQVDTYTGTNDHYLFGRAHTVAVVGAAVLGTQLPVPVS